MIQNIIIKTCLMYFLIASGWFACKTYYWTEKEILELKEEGEKIKTDYNALVVSYDKLQIEIKELENKNRDLRFESRFKNPHYFICLKSHCSHQKIWIEVPRDLYYNVQNNQIFSTNSSYISTDKHDITIIEKRITNKNHP